MANYILNVEDYTTEQLARNERNGASGVALFIRNGIKFSKCELFDALNLEICAINISLNGKEVIVLTYYNPPNMEKNEKLTTFKLKEKIQHLKNKLERIQKFSPKNNGFGTH